ncbi:MAG: NAD(P)-binding protein, partial [Pseudomonadota bacterium]|nr:NAD(P)-binding protein [Pseudomonadota bacterium]
MTIRSEHIVVGGGISGLGIAHFAARRGVPTLVLEGGDRVGGCLHSRRFSDTGDFWVEAGSHSCFNSYGNLLEILADLALTHSLVAKQKLRYSL